MSMFNNVEFIKASAGSGKTYSLMERIEELVINEGVPVGAILATTFTVKAAGELKSRIRRKLLEKGRVEEAQQVEDALIGTVDSVCGRLLSDYAIDAGENPSMTVFPNENVAEVFTRALSETISAHQDSISPVAERLSLGEDKWVDVVRNLIDSARANGITAERLIKARDYSIKVAKKIYDGSDETLALEKSKDEFKDYLGDIEKVAKAYEKNEEGAKKEYGAGLCNFCALVYEYDGSTWKKLLTLLQTNPATSQKSMKGLKDALLKVGESIKDRMFHSKALQQDVTLFIGEVFSVAKEGLERFQNYKREFGIVDFTDQETKVLNLLNSDSCKSFRKAIKDRFKVVMVDEFQDTSPLQLSIFLKLNEIVGRSIWVGDSKQSIYSFRGADPSFMDEIMKGIEAADAKRENSLIKILSHSWRSRENLIEFSNEVFTRVFKNLPSEEVSLSLPDDECLKKERKGGRISVWQKKAAYQYGVDALLTDLAKRIKKMFEGPNPRLERYGDLAVLFKQNEECFKLSAALRREGLPVSIGGEKLKDDPIAYLGMCAYRRAYSLKDTIAEEILRRYVPNVNFDLIDDVEQSLTPLELLEKAIVAYGVEDYVRKGTDGEYGIATLEALRDLCREYMSDCALRDVPATQADFIRYFSETGKAGASVAGGDCIQVMTYHKAKGLEWPIVILGSLDKELKGSPFGVRVFQNGEFNADDPLANRILQYIPAPFGAIRRNECSHFDKRGIKEFDRQHKEVVLSAKEESKRLMYVGVTRAKDEVIFFAKKETKKDHPSGTPQISWLEAISGESLFMDNFMKEGAAKWEIGDSQKEFDVEMELLPDQDGGDAEMPSIVGWTDAVVGKPVNYLNSRISPSSMEGKDVGAAIGEKVEIGAGIGVTVFSNPEELGNCVHSYLAVAEIEKDECQQLAKKVVRQWGVESVMAFDKLVRAGEQLRTFIDERWAGAKIYTEVPMSFELPTGQVSEGFIDMLVETKDGYVIIDHKMVRSFEEEKLKVAYGAQLQCYRNAVEKATGKKVLQTFLHLPNQGVCMELKHYHPIAKDI